MTITYGYRDNLDNCSRRQGALIRTLGSYNIPTIRVKPLPYEIVSYEHVVDAAYCMSQITRKVETRMGCVNSAKIIAKVGIPMFYGGIDIAKRQHEICVLDQEDNSVLQMQFKNTQKGLEKLAKALDNLKPNEISFCLEANGYYRLLLFFQLEQQGYLHHVIKFIQSDALCNL